MSGLVLNPLAQPLLGRTVVTVGTLLGVILVALCVVERHHLREAHHRTLFRRWFTWLVITPLYTLAVLSGELTVLLLISVLVFVGLREYARLVELPRLYGTVLLVTGLAVAPVALLSTEAYFALPALLLLGSLQPLLTQDVRAGTRHLAFAALGFAYLPWLLSHLLLLYRLSPGGEGAHVAQRDRQPDGQ